MESDAELLAAWRGGDANAGATLFDRHYAAVFRMFANKVGAEVEDLVQRTFLTCVERRDDIRNAASFRSYLLRVARNELYLFFRRRAGDVVDAGVTSVAALGISPSREAAQLERQERLAAALRSLPIENQVALELYYFEDLSGAEMADVLEVPEGTVRSRIRRGIALLREQVPDLELE